MKKGLRVIHAMLGVDLVAEEAARRDAADARARDAFVKRWAPLAAACAAGVESALAGPLVPGSNG